MRNIYTLAIAGLLSMATSAMAASTYQCSVDKGCVVAKTATTTSTYAATAYPIVLAHGMLGFDRIFGTSYWYNMAENLAAHGASVHVTKVSSFNSSTTRGEQLLAQVRTVMAVTGTTKVNIIGHSQGGLDARYVLGVSPESVASVTTIGTPHKGAKVADTMDAIRTFPVTSVLAPVTVGLTNLLGQLINLLSGGVADGFMAQDSLGTLSSLTTAGTSVYNVRFPQGVPLSSCGEGNYYASNGAALFSWGGVASGVNLFDPSDSLLKLLSLFDKNSSDGLVASCSSHFGKVIKDNYQLNHVDQVNHLFGLTSKDDPKALLRQHANRLKLMNL